MVEAKIFEDVVEILEEEEEISLATTIATTTNMKVIGTRVTTIMVTTIMEVIEIKILIPNKEAEVVVILSVIFVTNQDM